VTWHQFRHIHSTLLNDLRVPVKIAQEQLGHLRYRTRTPRALHAAQSIGAAGGGLRCGHSRVGAEKTEI